MGRTQRNERGGQERRERTRIVILVLALVVLMVAMNVQRQRETEEAAGTRTAAPSPTATAQTPAPTPTEAAQPPAAGEGTVTLESLPEYGGQSYVVLEDNVPDFPQKDMTATAFESYSQLDELGRCTQAYACVCRETMPTGERESIYTVKPTGWQSVQYDFVDGGSLYNRCHLIAFQLTAENANECNLITGTRYLNVVGMLPFENQVADYVKETDGHVLYRVTPVFQGDDLVCTGVRMEGWSVEDGGQRVCFDVFCYNVQPGVVIHYDDGASEVWEDAPYFQGEEREYILNTGTYKFHLPTCTGAPAETSSRRQEYSGTREMLIVQGYSPCGQCKP